MENLRKKIEKKGYKITRMINSGNFVISKGNRTVIVEKLTDFKF